MNASLKEWIDRIIHSDAPKTVNENRNEIKSCPLCHHNIEDRVISIYAELAEQLYDIYEWCGKNNRHEFSRKDIKGLLDQTGYARFADLIPCSNGILYRQPGGKDGKYGMHMARAKEFFSGTRPVHMQISLNQITGEKTVLKDVYHRDLPKLSALIDKNGLYDPDKLL